MNTTSAKVKCLLVDDVEDNLIVLSALLRRDDVELLLARSGAEALDLLLSHEVALAFLDVQMPEMDGFELAELMRGSERTRHVPIIFVTAGGRDAQRVFRGYDSGAVDFLYKPIEAHVLRNKADVFFQLYRQRQQLLLELQERTETLRLQEMFAAVLSHDLRNPLNAIATGAQLIQQNPGEAISRQAAARILSSSQRMTRMIENLLDLTRARLADGIPIVRARTDLGSVVARVVQEHQMSHPQRHIVVTSEGDVCGEWDGDRIGQVASNLIGNALQYGDEAHPIGVSLDGRDPGMLSLIVSNRGAIAPELLPTIFEPFSGGDNRRPRTGLGLGLYIAHQIVLAHEGHIGVESTEAGGTTFRVSVPRVGTLSERSISEADAIRS